MVKEKLIRSNSATDSLTPPLLFDVINNPQ